MPPYEMFPNARAYDLSTAIILPVLRDKRIS
jgi:hypothetical protein